MKNEVLLTVLDWGLGHATRCIPIVHGLQRQGANVILGGSGFSLELLRNTFPALESLELPSYQISYPAKGNMGWHFLKTLPRIKKVIAEEHALVNRFLETRKVRAIISDNRYGCYSEKVCSVFVGHQLNLHMPNGWGWASPMVNRWHWALLNNFNKGWIPDDKKIGLAGALASKKPSHFAEIGILSRFSTENSGRSELPKFEVVAVISGPEPSRHQFESQLRNELASSGKKCLLVKGVPGPSEISTTGNWSEVNHLPTTPLAEVIQKCEVLICRSGYSSLMDLAVLGKKAVLVPTPNQPEQEYLARHMQALERGIFVPQHQIKAGLLEQWKQKLSPLEKISPSDSLQKAIKEILC